MGWVGTDCVGVWLAQYFVLLSHCCPLYGHTVLCTCDQTIRPFYKSSIVHRTLRVFESHSPCYSSAAICINNVPCVVCRGVILAVVILRDLITVTVPNLCDRLGGWSLGIWKFMWDLVCASTHAYLRIRNFWYWTVCVAVGGRSSIATVGTFWSLIEIGGTISPLLGRV